jgi:hypothetical protein
MVMRRILVLLLLVLVPIPVAATPAWACSCKASTGVAEAELAFDGVVSAVADDGRAIRVTFAVQNLVKGVAGDQVTLSTSPAEAACGYRFDEGGRYRVYARAGETSLCSGNELLSAGTGYGARVDRVSTDRTQVFWAGSGAVLLVVVGALVWLFRQPTARRSPR